MLCFTLATMEKHSVTVTQQGGFIAQLTCALEHIGCYGEDICCSPMDLCAWVLEQTWQLIIHADYVGIPVTFRIMNSHLKHHTSCGEEDLWTPAEQDCHKKWGIGILEALLQLSQPMANEYNGVARPPSLWTAAQQVTRCPSTEVSANKKSAAICLIRH